MFPNVEAAVFASHHCQNLEFFDTIQRYPNLRGVVIREARDRCIFNLSMSVFPKQIKVPEVSLASWDFYFLSSGTPSLTVSGLRKLQLRREHISDDNWSKHRTQLHTFISRHPLLHTISFTPELDTHGNYLTGLAFPFLNDALRELAAIHSILIENLILVRDGVDNEWRIESISIALKSSVTTDNGTSKSVLDRLHTIIPTLRKVCVVIRGDRMHVESTVSQ